jgi:hypothetical protein
MALFALGFVKAWIWGFDFADIAIMNFLVLIAVAITDWRRGIED